MDFGLGAYLAWPQILKGRMTSSLNQTDCRADTTGMRQRALFGSIFQPCNQFGLFRHAKVTSGTCISTTRDPAMKSIQNNLFVRRVVPCIQMFHHH